jgi:hypothetical protein
MHRLLPKIKTAPNETRHSPEPRRRPAAETAGAPTPRGRRSLNEAAHKLSR